MKTKVAVLFGGQSTEHEVSRNSAVSVLKNIDRKKYDVFPIGITRDGDWIEYSGDINKISNGDWETEEFYKQPRGERILFNREVDVVFPVLHGLYGEDGTIQGLCKLVKIPCVGSSVMSSALCMDKVFTKRLMENFNIRQADYLVITKYQYEKDKEEVLKYIEKRIDYDVFVKPSNSGSSVGITKAHNKEELIDGINKALDYDRKIIIEKAIDAREIEVAILGNDEPIAAVPGEIIPENEFYDYESKYKSKLSKLIVPADLNKEKTKEIKEIAIKVYKILDCSGMARVDFLIERSSSCIYLSEVNTIPGFTDISMYPKMWEASNKSYKEIIDKLICMAIERKNN